MALLITIVAINLVGDQLRDVLNPAAARRTERGGADDAHPGGRSNCAPISSPRPASSKAVDGVDFSVKPGEIMGLVGESGSGKSMTGYSIIGLVDEPGRIVGGRILLQGEDLRQYSPAAVARRSGAIASR